MLVSMPVVRIEALSVFEMSGLGVCDMDDVPVVEEVLIYLSTDRVG